MSTFEYASSNACKGRYEPKNKRDSETLSLVILIFLSQEKSKSDLLPN